MDNIIWNVLNTISLLCLLLIILLGVQIPEVGESSLLYIGFMIMGFMAGRVYQKELMDKRLK